MLNHGSALVYHHLQGQVAEAKSGTTYHTARLRPPPSQRSGSNRKLEPGAWGANGPKSKPWLRLSVQSNV